MIRWWRHLIISSTFLKVDLDSTIEFVKQEFELSSRQSDGASTRDHLNRVWKLTGTKPEQLENLIEIPEEFAECWSWFLRLNNKRTSGGMGGINPISYADTLAFFNLLEYSPQQWELEMLELFDSLAMKHFAAEAEKQAKKQEAKSKK